MTPRKSSPSLGSISDDLYDLKKAVFLGNGEPSLLSRMTKLESTQGKISVSMLFTSISVGVGWVLSLANYTGILHK